MHGRDQMIIRPFLKVELRSVEEGRHQSDSLFQGGTQAAAGPRLSHLCPAVELIELSIVDGDEETALGRWVIYS